MASKNSKLVGCLAFARKAKVNLYSKPGKPYPAMKVPRYNSAGDLMSFGKFSGFYEVHNKSKYYRIDLDNGGTLYAKASDITYAKQHPEVTKCQKVVDSLVVNNIAIRKKLTRSLPLVLSLRKKGKLSSTHLSHYKNLVIRLADREKRVTDSKLLKVTTGKNYAYANLMKKHGATSLSISAVGAVHYLVWVVGAVVLTGVTAALTAYFTKYKGESDIDLKVSDDLEKALAVLDAETAAQVKEDLKEQINDAYKGGRSDEKKDSMLGDMKTILMLLLGAAAAAQILPMITNNSKT